MPEGDSLHRIAALLDPLVGERILAESPHPRGRVTGVARVLDGRVLERVEAVGKHLLLRFDGGVVLRSHLRMRGRWSLVPRGTPMRGRPWLVLRGRVSETRRVESNRLLVSAVPAWRRERYVSSMTRSVSVLVVGALTTLAMLVGCGSSQSGDNATTRLEAIVSQGVVQIQGSKDLEKL